jgi:flagellar protein FlaG
MEMKNPISAVPPIDPRLGASARPEAAPAPAATPAAPTDPANARLVIEQDQASGAYVYKTLDRITGEVLRQLPREEVLRMLSQARYMAGDVIKTRA